MTVPVDPSRGHHVRADVHSLLRSHRFPLPLANRSDHDEPQSEDEDRHRQQENVHRPIVPTGLSADDIVWAGQRQLVAADRHRDAEVRIRLARRDPAAWGTGQETRAHQERLHTVSTVSASSPTATARVDSPTGPPPKLWSRTIRTARSSRSRPLSSTSKRSTRRRCWQCRASRCRGPAHSPGPCAAGGWRSAGSPRPPGDDRQRFTLPVIPMSPAARATRSSDRRARRSPCAR